MSFGILILTAYGSQSRPPPPRPRKTIYPPTAFTFTKTEAGYVYEFEENTRSDLSRERKIPYTFSSIAFDLPDGRVFLASGKKIIILSYPGHEFVCEY